jgi:hypothetical protein
LAVVASVIKTRRIKSTGRIPGMAQVTSEKEILSDTRKGRNCLDDIGVNKMTITRLLKKYDLRITNE